jgi:hypothetical protein
MTLIRRYTSRPAPSSRGASRSSGCTASSHNRTTVVPSPSDTRRSLSGTFASPTPRKGPDPRADPLREARDPDHDEFVHIRADDGVGPHPSPEGRSCYLGQSAIAASHSCHKPKHARAAADTAIMTLFTRGPEPLATWNTTTRPAMVAMIAV